MLASTSLSRMGLLNAQAEVSLGRVFEHPGQVVTQVIATVVRLTGSMLAQVGHWDDSFPTWRAAAAGRHTRLPCSSMEVARMHALPCLACGHTMPDAGYP